MSSESQPAVLVVDDDEKNLYALKKILAELNISVHTANSGEEALKAIINREFFLILMDVCMPGMDGFETVALIRGNGNHKDIPIIFITAQSEKTFLETVYKEGVVDVIFKPILNAYPLICKIKVFLELYLNRKELEQSNIVLAQKHTECKQVGEELIRYRDHLEEMVKERTKELENKTKDLEEYNELFLNREFRINELKERVKELEAKEGSTAERPD